MNNFKLILLTLILLSIVFPGRSYAKPGQYQVFALNAPPPNTSSIATAINAKGDVVGTSTSFNRPNHATFWNGTGRKAIDLHLNANLGLPATPSLATGINDGGTIVGTEVTQQGIEAFCLTQIHKGWKKENPVKSSFGGIESEAFAINNKNEIVGRAETVTSQTAYYSDSCRSLQEQVKIVKLGPLPGDDYSDARAINNRSVVAGYSHNTGTGRFLATVWDMNNVFSYNLGTLPGGVDSVAFGITDAGFVVGRSKDRKGKERAVFWEVSPTAQWPVPGFVPSYRIVNIDTLANSKASRAWAINDMNNIVGWFHDGLNRRAFIHMRSTKTMYDLNKYIPSKSGWVLNEATAINDNGHIVGHGQFRGHTLGFVLIPVPVVIPKPTQLRTLKSTLKKFPSIPYQANEFVYTPSKP